jgi:phospholipid/cholesterol/gamma-HCH transport system ATP-binding protein
MKNIFGRQNKSILPVELRETVLSFGPNMILDTMCLSVLPGTMLALIGENSAGKSTILKVMVGLIQPESGQVLLFGRNTAKVHRKELDRLRRRVGLQFQAGAMFDSMTVIENMLLVGIEGTRVRAIQKPGHKEIMDLLEQVGLAHAAKLRLSELSGDIRKRAALARALIAELELALFDEPTAGLDPTTASRIINLLRGLSSRRRAAMILATSDVYMARRFSSDLILVQKSKIVANGGLKDLMASTDPYVSKYLSRFKQLAQAGTGGA